MEAPAMKVTRKDMANQQVPIHSRDYCAHKLIPLNTCRRSTMFMPWHCEEERHTYEICLYQEYERRRIMKTEMRRQAKEQG